MKYPTSNIPTIVRTKSFNSMSAKIFILAWEQFLSDVGGAAGLVLGISLATIFGVFDCSTIILINCCRMICRHLSHSISDNTHFMIQSLVTKTSRTSEDTFKSSISKGFLKNWILNLIKVLRIFEEHLSISLLPIYPIGGFKLTENSSQYQVANLGSRNKNHTMSNL